MQTCFKLVHGLGALYVCQCMCTSVACLCFLQNLGCIRTLSFSSWSMQTRCIGVHGLGALYVCQYMGISVSYGLLSTFFKTLVVLAVRTLCFYYLVKKTHVFCVYHKICNIYQIGKHNVSNNAYSKFKCWLRTLHGSHNIFMCSKGFP